MLNCLYEDHCMLVCSVTSNVRSWVSGILSFAGTEPKFVLFKWSSEIRCGRVEAEGNCLCMLFCHVKCVAQVHEESVTAPAQAILDVGIQKPGTGKRFGAVTQME